MPDVEVLHNEETFLLEDNIERIKGIIFHDEESYRKYMGSLWLLRDLVGENIDIYNPQKAVNHPQYPLYEMANMLISALHRPDTTFSVSREELTYRRYK